MLAQIENKPLDFVLPKILECAVPTEERGIRRDEVRLMVSDKITDKVSHDVFKNITTFLQEGDVLIINTSGTMNAAIPITLPNGKDGRIHLSTKKNKKEWIIEIRQVKGEKTKRYFGIHVGDQFQLPNGGKVEIIAPFYSTNSNDEHLNLWQAQFAINSKMESYLEEYGIPIKYSDVENIYPNSYYQTVFANEMGSAEMPSAGRAFTPEVITQLVAKGVQFAPVLLHTGVASLEIDERPYPEYFRVPNTSAQIINQAKKEGRRIIAIGTTAIRAIESAINSKDIVIPSEGFTHLFITPERGLKIVNGMLTGFHEPKASHLLMMAALAREKHLELCYEEAVKESYQWHEFGDLHLIL